MFTTLITSTDLAPHLHDPQWVIVDTRYDHAQPAWGEGQYHLGHIPGAVYAHLDRDLAGPPTEYVGRHPLPDLDSFQVWLGRWGIGPGVQVVVYDQLTGMWASRLWWMLKFLGHDAVAVLEGGLTQWLKAGFPIRAQTETPTPAHFVGAPRPELALDAEAVERIRTDPAWRLIDSRAPERYRGDVEPIDPVAGHIPGAVNHFNLSNVQADGTWLAPDELRARFQRLLGDVPPTHAVTYCGSGVAAAHNLLALTHAGLPGGKVYVGSWSQWCRDPARPVAKGNK